MIATNCYVLSRDIYKSFTLFLARKRNSICFAHTAQRPNFFFKFKESAQCTEVIFTILSSGGFPISSVTNKPVLKLVNFTYVRAWDAHDFVMKFETANYTSELGKVSVIHSEKNCTKQVIWWNKPFSESSCNILNTSIAFR